MANEAEAAVPSEKDILRREVLQATARIAEAERPRAAGEPDAPDTRNDDWKLIFANIDKIASKSAYDAASLSFSVIQDVRNDSAEYKSMWKILDENLAALEKSAPDKALEIREFIITQTQKGDDVLKRLNTALAAGDSDRVETILQHNAFALNPVPEDKKIANMNAYLDDINVLMRKKPLEAEHQLARILEDPTTRGTPYEDRLLSELRDASGKAATDIVPQKLAPLISDLTTLSYNFKQSQYTVDAIRDAGNEPSAELTFAALKDSDRLKTLAGIMVNEVEPALHKLEQSGIAVSKPWHDIVQMHLNQFSENTDIQLPPLNTPVTDKTPKAPGYKYDRKPGL